MVVVARDPVIVGCTFKGGGAKLGENRSFAGHGGAERLDAKVPSLGV